MAVIETFGLSRNFGKTIAVEDVTLAVEAGEVLGFLGPNGAGKTTTIRMLAGMIAPTEGYAIVAGHRTDRDMEQLHEMVGMLTQTPGLYDRLSARRNLQYFASFYPSVESQSQVEKYLKLMGLWERRDSKAGTFSKGMKQRLALARALVHEPKVLFLDEPTAGLDPEAAGEVRQLIRTLREEGRTVFLSTHNLNEAEMLCSRIAVIHTRLLALDTPEQLRRRFFRRQIIVQLEASDAKVMEVVKSLPFVQEARGEGSQLILELTDLERNRPELVKAIVEAGGRVIGVSEKQYPLEDVYLKLIREESGNES
ncbi:MAG: ABC transporter ATP-binding protein [Dehalococcoidia bacterium]|nr:ABC transporter ATP-binding protein [Dehalococcoidia bacterium]MDH4299800.1 ABC transporter ATP-binding protein [Dehalococcoidia bacterium]